MGDPDQGHRSLPHTAAKEFRDPVFGVLVCRACLWTATLHYYLAIAGKIAGVLPPPGCDIPEDGAEDGDDDLADEDDDLVVEESLEDAFGNTDIESAPEVPQATSPNAVEKSKIITPPPAEDTPKEE